MENLIWSSPCMANLQLFAVFAEYFLGLSIIYVLILLSVIIYNFKTLIVQRGLSECFFLILVMASCLILNDDLIMFSFTTFNNSIINDYFGVFTQFLICFFCACYFLIIAKFLEKQQLISFEYLLILLLSILGILFMCISNDFLISYLAIELSSLAFYVLACFRKTSFYSIESGVIYFITGSVSSAFFLLGVSLIYGWAGSINFEELFQSFSLQDRAFGNHFQRMSNQHLQSRSKFKYAVLEFSLMLISFSLFIKIAAAPFHLWSIDVYEGSPTSSAFFFAVIAKLSVFVLLIRLFFRCFFVFKSCWQIYFFFIGFLSIFVGSLGGLKQRKLKTLLAYSSVSHMGYSLLALSVCNNLGIETFLFYIFVYMIGGSAVWHLILTIKLKTKTHKLKQNKELNDFTLLKIANPGLAFCFAILMFSMAGIPPLVGFLAKMNVFLATIKSSFFLVSLISIFCSVVGTFYYIRFIKIFYFDSGSIGKLYEPIKSINISICSFFIFLLFLIFLNPSLLYLINCKIVLCLFLKIK